MKSSFWLFSLLSGLAIFGLLGWHMTVMHLGGLLGVWTTMQPEPLAWEDVVARGGSVTYACTYIFLLGVALFHGFYGLHNILAEYWKSEGAGRVVVAGCWITGGALFTIGTYSTLAFYSASIP
jgi:succinate dehydrogenase hydrophobic anchor subunit